MNFRKLLKKAWLGLLLSVAVVGIIAIEGSAIVACSRTVAYDQEPANVSAVGWGPILLVAWIGAMGMLLVAFRMQDRIKE